ncbi:MAG: GTPase HflX [Candidatus Cloacimonas sp. 4484_275]|nr:MAG: GTPase HflX [Candidatus Cloacimonas sp. 4484_275]
MIEKEKVFLIGVFCGEDSRENYSDSIEELKSLAETAELEIEKVFVQFLAKPNSSTYLGKGKIREIANQAKSKKIKTLVFNDNLSPAQSRNISNLTRCNVVDRTELILDIFAKHAKTKQAKLQVELAQLEYSYTKLKNLWRHLSRIEGGIGFRGPGEKQIEIDRREIRKRVALLKSKLEEIKKNSITKRKKRHNFTAVSLVGYTNAGKSTLFNLLTKEKRFVADQLFATLDSTTRAIFLPSKEKVVITDTVGFIKNLPHKLISSFHSTLLEVTEADLLLHIVDISHSKLLEHIEAVENVLKEIGANEKNILLVFNKCDKLNDKYYKFLRKKLIELYPDSVFISAKENVGITDLVEKLEEFCERLKKLTTIRVPIQLQSLISFIHKNAEILEENFNMKDNEQVMRVKIPRRLFPKIQEQIINYKIKEFINK